MIKFFEPEFGEEEKKNVFDCLSRNSITQGDYVRKFEEAFAKYCNVKYAVAVNNGTSALHLALVALGIGKGDEVIVPSFTFISSANAIVYAGATPVFIDCDDTFCINPGKIEKLITKNTRAIMPVHIYGNVCDMDRINEIAKKHNLYVIEDAAESHGSEYKGRKTGSFSDIGCFSFYGNKTLTTGEGGMCLTNDMKLKEKMELLRAQGKPKRTELKTGEDYAQKQFYHHIFGFNFRMTELQAAVGLAQLKKINEIVEKRRKIAESYSKLFNGRVKLQNVKPYAKHNYWMYGILLKDRKKQIEAAVSLKEKNIPVRSFFYPVHRQPFYNVKTDCPVAEDISERGLCLPNDIHMTESEIKEVVKGILK